ncbi:MAG: NAD(P)-dependent oxidoreductase [Nitrososphaerota archaeon]
MQTRIAIVRAKGFELFGIYTDTIEKLKRFGEVEVLYGSDDPITLANQLLNFQIVITEILKPKFTSEFFEKNKDVQMIFVNGRGYDNVDVKAAEEYGVLVARVPGWCEAEAVAEHTIALLLTALRKLGKADKWVKSGEWWKKGYISADFVTKNIKDLIIGIIGFGWIGSRTARILKYGFSAKEILIYDPYIPDEKAREAGFHYTNNLNYLLQESDVILIHAELTPETYHMIGKREFKMMKDNVIIINTARGPIIDTSALIESLESGKIGYVALDVVEDEPINKDHPLLKFDNVLITPHIAYATWYAIKCMDYSVINAIENFLKGEEVWETIVKPKNPRKTCNLLIKD